MLKRLFSLFLLSGGGLALEICLTRLFAAVYFPPYVFAVLALAVLGIGLGAALGTLQPRLQREAQISRYMALAGLMALVIVIVFTLTASIDLSALLLALVIVPYALIGLALVALFSHDAARSPQLYMADLIGAGAGAALAIPLMNALGPLNGVLVVGAMLALAGYALHDADLPPLETGALLLAFAVLGSNLTFGWLTLDYATIHNDKPIKNALSGDGSVRETIWGSFARTDLVQPGDGGPLQIYIDGAAASVMPSPADVGLLRNDIGFFAFATAQPETVMVIGAGGGLDVSFGLQSGAREIVAVEVNPASVELVEDYSVQNGDLYRRPGVRVVVDEGRSVLRREDTRYDLISLSQVVTLAAERSGYALTENTIYTVEAFTDYLNHLTADGLIAIKLYDEITLTRALSTAIVALNAEGLSDAEALRHTAALLDARSNPPVPLLMVRRTPFTEEEAAVMAGVATDLGFTPLYLPGVLAQPPLDAVEAGTMTFESIIAQSDTDISPPTDNRPFFYQFERGIPASLTPLLTVLASVLVIGGVLVVTVQRRTGTLRWNPLYFAALGFSFIAVEIALIQQTRLFIGHPTLAVTTVLATLLIGGGIGSLIGGRWLNQPSAVICAAVALYVLLWLLIWPGVSDGLRAEPITTRVIAVMVGLLPLALLMGMPFPLGLTAVGTVSRQQVALAWAVNGVLTVVGSVGSITLAILAGFNAVLLAGLLGYGAAALLARVVFHQREPISTAVAPQT